MRAQDAACTTVSVAVSKGQGLNNLCEHTKQSLFSLSELAVITSSYHS